MTLITSWYKITSILISFDVVGSHICWQKLKNVNNIL